ncbi:Transcriptional regulator, TetR protein [Pseudomonas syringae pv. delphinii]|nr:Transcriptional regulator, TetR family protein [Pseudomonas syringae pv. delphinii]RMP24817.1 Transcriptional regulator, TetR protein [Pseudomonas syringae pv. delphinii]
MSRMLAIMKKPVHDMRQHIIDVARSLMTNKGYTAVGLAEVLSTAGVPKGSFYYYFKSKEEFGQALLEEYFSEYLGRVDALMARPGTGAERLLAYFRYWSETQGTDLPEGKCLVVKLGAEVCDLSEDMRCVLEVGTAKIIQRISACVEMGVSDGSIHPEGDHQGFAESLYQLWLGASLLVKVNKSTESFDKALNMTKRLLK